MRRGRFGQHVVYPRAARATADGHLETLQRLRVSFRLDFHAAVVQVAHPARQPLARGSVLGEEPEADTLDAAGDDVAAGHQHGKPEL